jgi:hypothetical protein
MDEVARYGISAGVIGNPSGFIIIHQYNIVHALKIRVQQGYSRQT